MIFLADLNLGWFGWDEEGLGWDEADWATAAQLVDDAELWRYLSLIISQHGDQPRYVYTVAISVLAMVQGLHTARLLPTLFDLDTATGQALDFTGQWIGLSRRITVQETNFFSWDTDDLGWDEAEWSSLYSDDHATVVLDDEHYRLVLRARVASNQWDGTRDGAYDAWHKYFAPLGYQVLIQDNYERQWQWLAWDEPLAGWDGTYWDKDQLGWGPARCTGNMWMTMVLIGPPPDRLLEALFAGGYFDLRPAGVGMGYLTTQSGPGSEDGFPLFAWDEGPEDPVPEWFSWDELGAGWNEAPWYPVYEFFTLDGTVEQGLDAGVWVGTAPQQQQLAVIETAQPRQVLLLAGWDIGAWPREIRPLHITDRALEAA